MRVVTIAAVAVTLAALGGCAARVPPVMPPPVVATVAPPPPVMPVGGYPGMEIARKRDDGTYVTPNFQMTDAAAVWHLRGALNVAALGCDKTAAGAGGRTVAGYNAWLTGHRAVLDRHVRQYLLEWQATGWGDWQAAYDNQQTRLYNFYSQPAIRIAFCTVAGEELDAVAAVADDALPAHARAALVRLDQPFVDFFTAFDKWRDHYEVKPPRLVATIPQDTAIAGEAPAASPPIADTVPATP